MRIALEKRIRSLELYIRSELSFSVFKSNWEILYGNEPHPCRKYMFNLHKKFRKYGSLTNLKRKPIRPVRTQDVITDVAAYHNCHKDMSLRSFFREESFQISQSTLRSILIDDLGYKSYKCRKFHRLNEQDYLERYNMCKYLTKKFEKDPTFFSNLIWTDECFFKLNGTRNTHNIRFWASENPHIYEEKSQNAVGTMVFVAISAHGPVGPFFLMN